jgi:hypothetical protein
MCTLSQKNAGNDYFVHTEAKSNWSEYWSGRAHNGKAATVDNNTPMPHDANSATADNSNLKQELEEAKAEIDRLTFLLKVYPEKMLAHEKQINQLNKQRDYWKEEYYKLKVDRESLLVNMFYFENHLNYKQRSEIEEEKNKMLQILKVFCDWDKSGETFRDAHRKEAHHFHWQLQKYLDPPKETPETPESEKKENSLETAKLIAKYSGFIKYKHILDPEQEAEETERQERGPAGFQGNVWL